MTADFVLDTNVALEWLLQEPVTPTGRAAYSRFETAVIHAPTQLWAETHTGLLKRERDGTLTPKGRSIAVRAFDAFEIVFDTVSPADFNRLLKAATRHELSIYDALFLDVALERHLPLATNDRALRRAAHAEGITLV